MSADNWAACPRCVKRQDPSPLTGYYTLREDWEIGVFDGTAELYIRYVGRCTECGLHIRFIHTEPVALE